MAISKKFFVNLDLQGNSLVNPTVGANSNMTTAGAFQYNDAEFRLEYYNGTLVEQVANLSDISAVTGGLIFQGGYDPTTNTPDITVVDDTVFKGFFWVATAAGTFLGETVQVGDSIIAKQDNPGSTAANWLILQGNVVIATDTVDGIVRLGTQEEVNGGVEGGAVVVTPATLQGKIDAQITPAINDKLSLTGGTMSGNIDMGGNNITNGLVIQGQSIETDELTSLNNADINLSVNLDAQNSASIINLPAPTNGGDAANKTYVDGQINAQSYTATITPLDWTLVDGTYQYEVTHNLNYNTPIVTTWDADSGVAEFFIEYNGANASIVKSNFLPSANIVAVFAKATPSA